MDSTPRAFFAPGDADRLIAEIDDVRALEAMLGHAQAQRIRALAAIAGVAVAQTSRIAAESSRLRDMPLRSVAAELGAATHQHDRTVQRELDEAYLLDTRLPATIDALESGRISMRHVSAILDAGMSIADSDVRAAWEATVLDVAAQQAPGRTKAYALELAEAVNPETMSERFARAVQTRGVSVSQLADGMSQLVVVLPTTVAQGIADRIGRMARRLRDIAAAQRAATDDTTSACTDASSVCGDPSPAVVGFPVGAEASTAQPASEASGTAQASVVDARTLAQMQADVVADLLLTSAPTVDPTGVDGPDDGGGLGAIRATVQVVIPVTTLTGVTDAGATLDGRAPIDADTARRLAGDAPGWDRVLLHPVTGTVLDVDRYEPTAAQRRFLRVRDRHCRAPGCRQPAHRCQIDHNHEHHDGGRTALGNLAHLCVRHHTLKSETPWTVHQRADGTLEFRSPLGSVYEDPPPPRVVFVPMADAAPF